MIVLKIISFVYKKIKLDNNPEKIIFLILFIFSLSYLFLHSLYVLGINLPKSHFSNELYRVTRDHSYAEFFQYQTLLGSCILILLTSLKDFKYILILPFFFTLLLDDYLRIHDVYSVVIFESFDEVINSLAHMTGLRIKDFYELFWHLISLILFIISLFIFFFKDEVVIIFLQKYIFAVLCLIFFAIFVDIAGVQIMQYVDKPKSFINTIIYFLEEGGEMIKCSYIFSILFGLCLEKNKF